MIRNPGNGGTWLDCLALEAGEPISLRHESAFGYAEEVAAWGGLPASRVADLDFIAINQDLLTEQGWDLQVTPGQPYAWHLSAPGPECPAVFLEGARAGESECVFIEEEDPLTAHFDLRAAECFGFLLPGGKGVVIDARAAHPVVSVSGGVRSVESHLPEPELETWLGNEVSPWLAKELVDSDDPFRAVANAGTWVRLRQPTQEQLASLKDVILRGQRHPRFESARAWATRWTESETQAVLVAALKRLVALECTLAQRFAEHESPCRLFLERDDLESVRLLLAFRGEAAPLEGELRRLDAHGRSKFPRVSRVALCPFNDRLRRASAMDPEAWWALAATGAASET